MVEQQVNFKLSNALLDKIAQKAAFKFCLNNTNTNYSFSYIAKNPHFNPEFMLIGRRCRAAFFESLSKVEDVEINKKKIIFYSHEDPLIKDYGTAAKNVYPKKIVALLSEDVKFSPKKLRLTDVFRLKTPRLVNKQMDLEFTKHAKIEALMKLLFQYNFRKVRPNERYDLCLDELIVDDKGKLLYNIDYILFFDAENLQIVFNEDVFDWFPLNDLAQTDFKSNRTKRITFKGKSVYLKQFPVYEGIIKLLKFIITVCPKLEHLHMELDFEFPEEERILNENFTFLIYFLTHMNLLIEFLNDRFPLLYANNPEFTYEISLTSFWASLIGSGELQLEGHQFFRWGEAQEIDDNFGRFHYVKDANNKTRGLIKLFQYL